MLLKLSIVLNPFRLVFSEGEYGALNLKGKLNIIIKKWGNIGEALPDVLDADHNA